MNAEVYAYNTSGVPAAVNALNAAHPQKFSIVDMNTGFSTAALPDGVHPNDVGYAELANRWRAGIKNVAVSAGCVPTP